MALGLRRLKLSYCRTRMRQTSRSVTGKSHKHCWIQYIFREHDHRSIKVVSLMILYRFHFKNECSIYCYYLFIDSCRTIDNMANVVLSTGDNLFSWLSHSSHFKLIRSKGTNHLCSKTCILWHHVYFDDCRSYNFYFQQRGIHYTNDSRLHSGNEVAQLVRYRTSIVISRSLVQFPAGALWSVLGQDR